MKLTKSQILNFLHSDEIGGIEHHESQTLLLPFREGESVVPSACHTLFITQQGNRYIARLVYTQTKNWYLECGDENSDVQFLQTKESNFILSELQSPQSACSIQRRYNKSFQERKQSASNTKGGMFCSHIKLLLSVITSQTLESLEAIFDEVSNQNDQKKDVVVEPQAKEENTLQSLKQKDETQTLALDVMFEENREPIKETLLEPYPKALKLTSLPQSYTLLTSLSMLLHKLSFKGEIIQVANRLETLEYVMKTYAQEHDVHMVILENFDLDTQMRKDSLLFASLRLAINKRVLLYLDISRSSSNFTLLYTALNSTNGIYCFAFEESAQISIPVENLQIILNIRSDQKVRGFCHYDDALETKSPMKVLQSICDTAKIPHKERLFLERFLNNMLYLYATKKLSLKIDPLDIKRKVIDFVENPDEIYSLLKLQKSYWILTDNPFEFELVDLVIDTAFSIQTQQTQKYFYI